MPLPRIIIFFQFPNHRIQLDTGMVGWVGAHGERLLANDVRAESHYINFYPDVIPTCSELSVPIRVGEQIAVAIANARLYEAAQQARGTSAP